MTETEKNALRVKIALLFGWSFLESDGGKTNWLVQVYFRGEWQCQTSGWVGNCVPDYPNDLNACSEFEKTLTSGQHYTFRCRLWELTNQSEDESWRGVNGEEHNRRYCSATAEQRCLAFVATMEAKTMSETKTPKIVAPDARADEMNCMYGESYGVDWIYPKDATAMSEDYLNLIEQRNMLLSRRAQAFSGNDLGYAEQLRLEIESLDSTLSQLANHGEQATNE